MASRNQLLKNMRATTCQPNADGFRLVYHSTCVFEVRNGKATLDSGGWRTDTTKRRINWALSKAGSSWQIFQKNHSWLMSKYLGDGKHSEPVEFVDGMKIDIASDTIIS